MLKILVATPIYRRTMIVPSDMPIKTIISESEEPRYAVSGRRILYAGTEEFRLTPGDLEKSLADFGIHDDGVFLALYTVPTCGSKE